MKKFYSLFALATMILAGLAFQTSAQVYTFSCPTTTTSWVVPPGVTTILVDVQGAAGGVNSVEGVPYLGYTFVDRPGYGARVQGQLTVVPGTTLNIYVGGNPATATTWAPVVAGGFNGGGNSYGNTASAGLTPGIAGGGGGGASDIRIGGTALANRVVVAGGGGGAGCDYPTPPNNVDRGGDGGGTTGENGFDGSGTGLNGRGGTPATGGAGGGGAAAGTLGNGGNALSGSGGGGGGGGYYGGGGSYWAGGGGGSSFTDPVIASGVVHTRGYNTGCGSVTITIPCATGATAVNSGPTCFGGIINLTATTTGTVYSWSGPGGFTSTSLTPVLSGVTPAMTGVYTFTATSAIGSCSTIATTTVSLLSAPPTPTVTPTSASICNGGNVTLVAATAASSCPAPILSQNFDAGIGAWTITNIAGSAASFFQWRTSPGYLGVAPGDGSPYVEAAPDAFVGVTSTILRSPSFSTVGYTAATLTFNQYYRNYINDITVQVQYSIDGGATWPTLINQLGTPTGTTTWTTATPTTTIALPPAAIGVPNVMLRWDYASNFGWYWAIDNVLITGTAPGTVSWSPATHLYTDPAFTVPYIAGAFTSTVYVHPTSVAIPTVITYSAIATSSCATCPSYGTSTVTINPGALPISGITTVCTGTSVTLTDASAGGTWSTTPGTGSVTIVSGTGVMTGGTAGTATVSYTMPGGCYTTTVVTVTAMPTAILGPSTVCTGQSINLTDPVTGGAWSSTNVAAGTIDPATGVLTGVGSGVTTITYSFSPSCYQVKNVTVNPLAPITGTPAIVCSGLTIAVADAVPGGTWSSSVPGVAVIGSSSGSILGLTAGTTIVLYTTPANCIASTVVTVNPTPVAISGTTSMCLGQVAIMSDGSTGGAWTSSNTAVATIVSATGFTTAVGVGTSVITYMLPAGCTATMIITVNPVPGAISGNNTVCAGTSITLSDATPSGTWSSSAPGIAAINPVTGVVFGVSAGTSIITYQLATGCNATMVLTVNPSPVAISGNHMMCLGLTTQLTDVTTGGTWSSSNTAVATIDAATGLATGVATGTSTITYTLSAGCTATTTITVNPVPGPINGVMTGCVGATATLSDATAGGTWSTSDISIATIGGVTGVVTAVSGGTATISYSLTTTGCYATAVFTVNPPPAPISGSPYVCQTLTTLLTDATGGGTWSSSVPARATIDAAGLVTGITPGTSTISYILPTTCFSVRTITVVAAPTAINGANKVCVGSTTTLTDGVSGGNWTVTPVSGTASIGASTGIVTGLTPGTVIIYYTTFACNPVSRVMSINPLPMAIQGEGSVCAGSSTTVSDATPGGTWSSTGASISPSGVVTGLSTSIGATVTYMLPTGCYVTAPINVFPVPDTIRGADSVCPGSSVFLTDSTPGGVWSSSDGTIALSLAYTGEVRGMVAGNVHITYTLISGCYATKPFLVSTPIPVFLDVTSSPVDSFLCHNIPDTLRAIPQGIDDSNATYVWELFGSYIGSGNPFVYNPTHGDYLTCVMTTHNVCAAPAVVAKNVVLNIWPLGGPIVEITCAQPDTSSYLGQVYTFYSTVTFGGPSPTYQWYINNAPVAGATAPVFTTHMYLENDTIYCVVNGNSPCDTGSFIGTSNTKVIHGQGYLSVGSMSQGNDLSLFPNPNNGSFTLSGRINVGTDNEVNLEVTDMLGRTVYTGKTMPSNGSIKADIKLNNEAAGSYLLRVQTETGSQAFHFVIGK